jgi:hypothetical protein
MNSTVWQVSVQIMLGLPVEAAVASNKPARPLRHHLHQPSRPQPPPPRRPQDMERPTLHGPRRQL